MTDPIIDSLDRSIANVIVAGRRARANAQVFVFIGLCLGIVLVDVLDLRPIPFIVFCGLGYLFNIWLVLRK